MCIQLKTGLHCKSLVQYLYIQYTWVQHSMLLCCAVIHSEKVHDEYITRMYLYYMIMHNHAYRLIVYYSSTCIHKQYCTFMHIPTNISTHSPGPALRFDIVSQEAANGYVFCWPLCVGVSRCCVFALLFPCGRGGLSWPRWKLTHKSISCLELLQWIVVIYVTVDPESVMKFKYKSYGNNPRNNPTRPPPPP